MKYKCSMQSFCSQALHNLKSRSKDIILLQKKINIFFIIFINNIGAKPKEKKETKGIEFTISHSRITVSFSQLCSLCIEPTNDCTACLHCKI